MQILGLVDKHTPQLSTKHSFTNRLIENFLGCLAKFGWRFFLSKWLVFFLVFWSEKFFRVLLALCVNTHENLKEHDYCEDVQRNNLKVKEVCIA